MRDYPTPWQKKICWSALSSMAVAALVVLSVATIWVVGKVVGFLQPLLLPVALAAVMAFLLEPVVQRFGKWGVRRHRAVILVFMLLSVTLLGLATWIGPRMYTQSLRLASKLPTYTLQARERLTQLAEEYSKHLDFKRWLPILGNRTTTPATPSPTTTTDSSPATSTTEGDGSGFAAAATAAAGSGNNTTAQDPITAELTHWAGQQIPNLGARAWTLVQQSVGGFLGVFGFLISIVVAPLYLYYFLIEGPNIAKTWGDYLPLRASHFKDEVVDCLTQINAYLIAFFRGQLVVSLINGVATGLGLMLVGLDFGLLIGLILCVLGIIPYLGIILSWIPAIIIAIVQGKSYLIQSDQWWMLPLAVTIVFIVIQQIDGLFITPRIVGDSVGLHPVTVILSMFGWSLLLGGLLGAILAVPLTAALKVILQRYVWQKRRRPVLLAEETPPESEASP